MGVMCKAVELEAENQAVADRIDHVHAVWSQAVTQWENRARRYLGHGVILTDWAPLRERGHLDLATTGKSLVDFYGRWLSSPSGYVPANCVIDEEALSTFQATMLEGGVYRSGETS